jgi:hypothetical protein
VSHNYREEWSPVPHAGRPSEYEINVLHLGLRAAGHLATENSIYADESYLAFVWTQSIEDARLRVGLI